MLINYRNWVQHSVIGMALTLCTVACSRDDYASEEDAAEGISHITIKTRAAGSNTLSYPISLYFYSNGSGATDEPKSFVINEADVNAQEKKTIDLPYGSYTAHALSGTRTFTNGYATTPLYYGSSTLTVASENQDMDMSLTGAVAKVTINMANIPEEVTAVSVAVASQYTAMADNGAMTGSASATIACQKVAGAGNEGQWTTGDFYVLPGTDTKTTITVQLIKTAGSDSYTMTYESPLTRNTPYEFTLTYKSAEDEQGHINVSFALGEWNTKVTQNFEFGPDDQGGNVSSGDYPTLSVSDYPTGVVEIDNHAVIPFGDNHLALLFSKKNFPNVAYGASLSSISEASTYTEGSITGWTIPTTEEANIIIEKCAGGENFTNLNRAIGHQNVDPVDASKKYLCNDNLSVYTLGNNATVSAATTGQTYDLRLVRTVRLVKQ